MQAGTNVANVIYDQIKAGMGIDGTAGQVCMMAWGATDFSAYNVESEKDQGHLTFKVSGAKFKGTVKVRLMWNDTYTVELWRVRAGNVKMLNSRDDVHWDFLTGTIDHLVETD